MVDIDNFDAYNQEQGYKDGDNFLIKLGNEISTHLSSCELASRFGSDEFALVLRGVDKATIVERCEHLRVAASKLEELTVSIGVAHFPTDAKNFEQLVTGAEDALYTAKRGGRNRVSVSKTFNERFCKPLVIDDDDKSSGSVSPCTPPPPNLSGGGAELL